jgi:DNA mismatch endonuclease, patch repair protein
MEVLVEYWAAKLQRNAARDKRSHRELRRDGWQVMVIWECQIGPAKREQLRARIIKFLDLSGKEQTR